MNKQKLIGGIVIFLVLTIIFAILGQYVGSMVFAKLANLPEQAIGVSKLWQYSHSQYMASPKVAFYVKLGFLAAILITLIPVLLMGIVAYIAREKQELHGSSRFANRGEIAGYGLLPSAKQLQQAQESSKPDILIGAKLGKQFLRFIGNEFALIAAATRQGKGIGVVVPNCLEYKHSLVVYDPKMENYLLTSGYREKGLKQKVFLFNPAGIMPAFEQMEDKKAQQQAQNFKTEDGYFLKSHRWNPYYYVSRNPLFTYTDLLNMANILYPLPPNDTGNAGFFARTAQKLFVGLSMYMIETENNRHKSDWQGKTSLSLLAKLLTPKETGLSFADWVKYRVLGEEADPESGIETQAAEISDICANLLSEVVHGEEKTMSNIMASFSAPLAIFNDPIVEAATSENDFDFRKLRQEKMSIYVAIQPNDLDRFAVLTNLFFSQLINENIKQGLPENNKSLKYQTLLLIDEFTLLGYMSVFQKGVSFIAGYNLRLLLIFQNRSQVGGVYKGTGANTFFSNFAVQTMFACKDHKEAMEYADLVGSFTMHTKSVGRSSSKGGSSHSTNISEQKRHLINPDEFKTLPFEKCVVTMIGKRPIKAEKIMYYQEPTLKDKVNMPPTTAPDLIVKAPSKRVVGYSDFSLDDEEEAKMQVEKNIEKSSDGIKKWVFERVLGEKGLPEKEENIPMNENMVLFKRLIGDEETLNFMAKFMA